MRYLQLKSYLTKNFHSMRAFLCIISLFLLSNIATTAQTEKQYAIRTIAFYNVENLFDYEDDPLTWDNDWTPNGKNNWTKENYKDKLSKLAKVISEIGSDVTGTTPDIIGLAEIENRRVLEDLISQPELANHNYGIIHYDSPDRRGIDVALIYKKDWFSPKFQKPYELILYNVLNLEKRKYTRDQLLVSGFLDNEEIHFIVNHWPSRFGGAKMSQSSRAKAARLNRKIIDSIFSENPYAKIITMGDFNDNPTDESLHKVLNAKIDRKKLTMKGLYNPMGKMHKKGLGTLTSQDAWHLFDQIIISTELAKRDDYTTYRLYKAGIFNKSYLRVQRGRYKGYPFRMFRNGGYTGGYSDHFPVFIYLIKEKQL